MNDLMPIQRMDRFLAAGSFVFIELTMMTPGKQNTLIGPLENDPRLILDISERRLRIKCLACPEEIQFVVVCINENQAKISPWHDASLLGLKTVMKIMLL